ncbi:hypothetical protein [Actinokineospora enzanensis]|uniref:hypothetical protein n=1 Tax=Actinokineospora enzanensis TaxID=155975 RepID=UPI00037BF2E8|nr:hypothetical protein [Actinokineospora enzanensis]
MGRPHREVPTWAQAQAAATRIWTQRQGDDRLPDPDDLLGIAHHVWRNPVTDTDQVQAEAADAVTILDFVRAHEDRVRLGVLSGARKAGMTLVDLAPILGFVNPDDEHAVRKSVHSYLRRLELGVAGLPKDEAIYRARKQFEDRKAKLLQAELDWLVRPEIDTALRTVAATILERATVLAEAADDLAELIADDLDDLRGDLDRCQAPAALDRLFLNQLAVTWRFVARLAHRGDLANDLTLHAALDRGRELIDLHRKRFTMPDQPDQPRRRRRRRRAPDTAA